jgi:hypothetical protein
MKLTPNQLADIAISNLRQEKIQYLQLALDIVANTLDTSSRSIEVVFDVYEKIKKETGI